MATDIRTRDIVGLAIAIAALVALAWAIIISGDDQPNGPTPATLTQAVTTGRDSSAVAKPEPSTSGPGIAAGQTCAAIWYPSAPSPTVGCLRSDGTSYQPVAVTCTDRTTLIIGAPERTLLVGARGARLEPLTVDQAAERVARCTA